MWASGGSRKEVEGREAEEAGPPLLRDLTGCGTVKERKGVTCVSPASGWPMVPGTKTENPRGCLGAGRQARCRCWGGGRDELPRAPGLPVFPLCFFSSNKPNPLILYLKPVWAVWGHTSKLSKKTRQKKHKKLFLKTLRSQSLEVP